MSFQVILLLSCRYPLLGFPVSDRPDIFLVGGEVLDILCGYSNRPRLILWKHTSRTPSHYVEGEQVPSRSHLGGGGCHLTKCVFGSRLWWMPTKDNGGTFVFLYTLRMFSVVRAIRKVRGCLSPFQLGFEALVCLLNLPCPWKL